MSVIKNLLFYAVAILLGIEMAFVLTVVIVLAFDSKDKIEPTLKFDEENSQRPTVMPVTMYLYVYNDETGLWNRAREEALKTAACHQLRAVSSTP